MLSQLAAVLVSILCAAGVVAPAHARGPACTAAASCADVLDLASGGSIRYYRSLPLSRNEAVRRAVIIVHGNGRNADDYFEHAIAAARREQRLEEALVLAPNFRTRKDGPTPGEHHWSSQGWKIGNRSRDPARISSFEVMDELLSRICSRTSASFPNLRTVVIAGHSAGAQFVNRYLAGGSGCSNPTVEVRYLVMNPSSYLYVDGRRRAAATGPFRVPDENCQDYDDYKYGLRERNAYMKGLTSNEIRRRLFTRHAWYLAGGTDTKAGGSLDQTCAARLQGPHRLARHANYRDYAALFEGWTGAAFIVVPGIGHSGRDMLASEAARRVAFR